MLQQYRINPKTSDTWKNCSYYPKIETVLFYYRERAPMQTEWQQCRPWSDCSPRGSLIWVYTVCPDLPIRKLRIITVRHNEWKTVDYSSKNHQTELQKIIFTERLGTVINENIVTKKLKFINQAFGIQTITLYNCIYKHRSQQNITAFLLFIQDGRQTVCWFSPFNKAEKNVCFSFHRRNFMGR